MEEGTGGTCIFVWPIIGSCTPSSMFLSQWSCPPAVSLLLLSVFPHPPSLCCLPSISADCETIRTSSTSAQSQVVK